MKKFVSLIGLFLLGATPHVPGASFDFYGKLQDQMKLRLQGKISEKEYELKRASLIKELKIAASQETIEREKKRISFFVRSYGFPSLGSYSPVPVNSLDELPRLVKEKVNRYLIQRFGEFCKKLPFKGGQKIEKDKMYEASPHLRNAGWTIPKYMLKFRLIDNNAKLEYVADCEFDEIGDVVRGINFPEIRKSPEKAYIVPLNEAYQIAQKLLGHSFFDIDFRYFKADDSLNWVFTSHKPKDGDFKTGRCLMPTIIVPAHDSKLVRQTESIVIVDY